MSYTDPVENIFSAIDTEFRKLTGGLNNSFFLALNGNGYRDECPASIGFPRCIWSLTTDVRGYETFKKTKSMTYITFDIYAETMAEVGTIYSYFNTLFQKCSLSITGNVLVWFREINKNCGMESVDPLETTAATSVARYSIDYEIKTQES